MEFLWQDSAFLHNVDLHFGGNGLVILSLVEQQQQTAFEEGMSFTPSLFSRRNAMATEAVSLACAVGQTDEKMSAVESPFA